MIGLALAVVFVLGMLAGVRLGALRERDRGDAAVRELERVRADLMSANELLDFSDRIFDLNVFESAHQ